MPAGNDPNHRAADDALTLIGSEDIASLFHAMPIGIVCHDSDGSIMSVNPAAEEILGLTADQIRGRTSLDPRWRTIREDGSPFPGESHPAMVTLRTGQSIQNNVMGVFHPIENKTRWIHVSTTPFIRPGDEKPYRVIATFADITDRVEAEVRTKEMEKQLRLFVDHTPAAIALFDNQMNYLAVNKRWLEDHRLKQESIIGRNHYEIFPEIPQRWKDIHQRCLAGATESCDEESFPRADGSMDWVRWEIQPWKRPDESIGGIILFSEFITKQKHAEKALLEREEQYHLLFNQSLEAILLTEPYGRLIDANPAACRMFGWSIEELRELDRNSLIDTSDPRLAVAMAERGKTGKWSGELNLLHRDGSKIICEITTTIFLDKNGHPISTIIARDSSKRRQIEEALSVSEERFRLAMDATNDGLWDRNVVTGDVYYSPSYTRMLGYEPHEFKTMVRNWAELVHPEDLERLLAVNQACIDGQRDRFEMEYRFLCRDGSVKWVHGRAKVIGRDEKERALRVVGVNSDIQLRKMAEEALHRRETQLRNSQEAAKIGDWNWEILSGTVNWSEQTFRLFDKDPATFSPSMDYFLNRIHPEDRTARNTAIRNALEKDEPYHSLVRVINETGRQWVMEAFGLVERKEDGQPIRVAGTAQDITERKTAEDRLRESEDRFNQAFQFMPVGAWITTLDEGRFLALNMHFAEIFGYQEQELLGHLSSEFGIWVHPEDRTQVITRLKQGEAVHSFEMQVRRKNGDLGWMSYSGDLVTLNGETCLLWCRGHH
jgi:PAS domain S-box-containing protein